MEIIDKEQLAEQYCELIDKTNSGVYSDDYDSYLAGFNEAESIYLKQIEEKDKEIINLKQELQSIYEDQAGEDL